MPRQWRRTAQPSHAQPPVLRSSARIFAVGAAVASAAAVALAGDGLAADAPAPTTEVVVTLAAPPLSAFGRSLAVGVPPVVPVQLRAAQNTLAKRIVATVPGAQVRWRYTHVANGLAVVLPRAEVARLAATPGVGARLAERDLPRAARHRRAAADRRRQALGRRTSRRPGTG